MTFKKTISVDELTVGEAGLTRVVQGMVKVLDELSEKECQPRAPNWHNMQRSEYLDLLVDAGFVNRLSIIGSYGSTDYCISKKGKEFYNSLHQ